MVIVLWIVQFHGPMILQKGHCINPAGANNSSSGNTGPVLTIFPLSSGCLSALVYQHSITPLALPCKLVIPDRGKS